MSCHRIDILISIYLLYFVSTASAAPREVKEREEREKADLEARLAEARQRACFAGARCR